MQIKTQSQVSNMKLYSKKLNCPQHGNKLKYKCQYQHCNSPFACHTFQCMQIHFHAENKNQLILSKLDMQSYEHKLGQLQQVFTNEDFALEAKQLKSFIDGLKSSMVSIYKDYKELHIRKEIFVNEMAKPFDLNIIEKVQETIELGKHLRNSIDALKSKVRINSHDDDTTDNKVHCIIQESGSPQIQNNYEKKYNEPTADKNQHQKASPQDLQQKNIITNPKQSVYQDIIELQDDDSRNDDLKNHKNQINAINNVQNIKGNTSQPDSFQQLFTQNPMKVNKTIVPTRQTIQNGKGYIEVQKGSHIFIYERDFFLKRELTLFLQSNLYNFSWGLTRELYSSHHPSRSIERFHDILQGKSNLLFIFIGEGRIIGSYFSLKYPRLTEKVRNDPYSFLFISEQKQILKFKAVSSQFHLSVSDKLYVCHGNTPSYGDGIRTFQKNFQAINYCLPSVSYKLDHQKVKEEVKTLSGLMKIKEFYVLQIVQS